MRAKRQVLFQQGPKRAKAGVPRVRVYVDSARRLVTVESTGRAKQSYGLTPAGKREAIAYAKAFFEEANRVKEAASEPVPTVRQLWHRYVVAFQDAWRPKTRLGHGNRWKLWERFVFHDTPADRVTADHLDGFKTALLAQEYASNQVAAMVGLVKQVFRWAVVERKALPHSPVLDYRLRLSQDHGPAEPEEYRLEEFERLVPAMGSPQDSRSWRAWCVLMLAGHQGARANAVLRLKVADLHDGRLWWQRESDKRHRTWSQPIRDGALAAILTAFDWRERDGYHGPWLIYPRPRPAKGPRTDRGGRSWPDGHGPYTYAAFHAQLQKAELAAKVPHLDLRAAHGLRKMVAGEILRLTGNPKAAMDFIGDQDLTLIQNYLKVREDEKDAIATQLDAMDRTRNMDPSRTGGIEGETAPAEVGAGLQLTKSHRSELNRRPLLLKERPQKAAEHETSSETAPFATPAAPKVAETAPEVAPGAHPGIVQQEKAGVQHLPGGSPK